MINVGGIVSFLLISGVALSLAFWPLRTQKNAWTLLPILLCTIVLGYGYWGAWAAQREFIHQQQKEQAVAVLSSQLKKPKVLIEKLQAHLAMHPNSARGWYLLGRLYASQQLWQKARLAFGKAYALNPEDEMSAVNYAQSLFTHQNLKDAEQARAILLKILEKHPQQADALLLLAIDAQHRHMPEQALVYWRQLLLLVPESSAEAKQIRRTIHDLQHGKHI